MVLDATIWLAEPRPRSISTAYLGLFYSEPHEIVPWFCAISLLDQNQGDWAVRMMECTMTRGAHPCLSGIEWRRSNEWMCDQSV